MSRTISSQVCQGLLSAAALATTTLAAHAAQKEAGGEPAKPMFESAPSTRPAPTSLSGMAPAKDEANAALNVPSLGSVLQPSAVLFDVADDGSIWARGQNYKAHFSSNEMTYLPRGGEGEFSLSIKSAVIGSHPVKLQSNAQPTRDDNAINIDRGDFTERYVLAGDSIEQLFLIDGVNNPGDLVIKLSINAPTMIASEKFDALQFDSPHGSLRYSKAVLVDAENVHTSLPTRLAGGDIEIRVPNSVLNRAAFPITIDPIITWGPVHKLDENTNRHSDVAFDVTNNVFCVTWEDQWTASDGDVFFAFFTANGQYVTDSLSVIDNSSDNWRHPKIANNNIANNFLVVAERGAAPTREIVGRIVAGDLSSVSANILIAASFGGDKLNPDVGGDRHPAPPTHYLVVWEHIHTAVDHDIFGRLINADATTQGLAFAIEDSALNDTNPAVSKNNGGGDWLIVWQHTYSETDEDIRGSVVHWDGQIITPTLFINSDLANDVAPEVSSPNSLGQYLAVYQRNGLIAASLTTTDSVLQSTTLETLGDNPFAETRVEPTVDSIGPKFVVGYSERWEAFESDYDLYATTLCVESGSLQLAEIHKNLDYGLWVDVQSQLASAYSAGGSASAPLMFSWTHDIGEGQAGFGDIYAATFLGHTSCCPADCAPVGGNGIIDVDDLLMVINQWSGEDETTCLHCDGDITGNLHVDVDDLLAVINAWGVCN